MKKVLLGAMLALSASFIYGSGMWWVSLAAQAGWSNYALGFVAAAIGSLTAYSLARQCQKWQKLPLRKYLPLLCIGLSLFGANVSMFLALELIEPAIVAFFVGLQVLWVAVIELLLRRVRFTLTLAFSILLCLTGTLFINEVLQFNAGRFILQMQTFTIGELLAILAGVLFGLVIYLIRQSQNSTTESAQTRVNNVSPAQTTAILSLVVASGNLLLVFGMLLYQIFRGTENILLEVGFVSLPSFLPWLYPILLGLGNFMGATLLQVRSQKYLSGSQVGVLLALQPIATIGMGLLFFGSELQSGQLIGGAMLLGASISSIVSKPANPL